MIRKLLSLMRGKSRETASVSVSKAPQPVSNKPNVEARTSEGMCGIDPRKMKPEEIRAKLAELYKRHNQAAGSLDAELRQEAEVMLDAIVDCRQKYVESA